MVRLSERVETNALRHALTLLCPKFLRCYNKRSFDYNGKLFFGAGRWGL